MRRSLEQGIAGTAALVAAGSLLGGPLSGPVDAANRFPAIGRTPNDGEPLKGGNTLKQTTTIRKVGVVSTANTVIITTNLTRPGNVELILDTDPNMEGGLAITTQGKPGTVRKIVVPAVPDRTEFWFKINATGTTVPRTPLAKGAKAPTPIKVKDTPVTGHFTTKGYGDYPTPAVRNGKVEIQGQPTFLFAETIPCPDPATIATAGKLGANVLLTQFSACDTSDPTGATTVSAIETVNQAGLLVMDTVDDWDIARPLKRLIGNGYIGDLFQRHYPDWFPSLPADGRLVDMPISVPWAAGTRYKQPLPWSDWPTSYKDYFGKANVLTMNADPYLGNCGIGKIVSPNSIKESGSWIAQARKVGKAVLAGIRLSAMDPTCSTPNKISPAGTSAWRWSAIINGARGFSYRTDKVGGNLSDIYAVDPGIEAAARADQLKISALQPMILLGNEIPTTVTGSSDVIATTFDYANSRYNIVTNTSEKPAFVKVTSEKQAPAGGKAQKLWSKNKPRNIGPDGAITANLDPYETEIYRIS